LQTNVTTSVENKQSLVHTNKHTTGGNCYHLIRNPLIHTDRNESFQGALHLSMLLTDERASSC